MTASPTLRSAVDLSFDDLSFDQPVPRAIVHKWGPGEVFVTDSKLAGDSTYLIAGELPRSHAFYGDTTGGTPAVDPVTMIELGRQAGYVVLHEHLGVGLDNSFVIRDIHAVMAPSADALTLGGPVPVLCVIELTEPTYRRGTLAGFRMSFALSTRDGRELASGDAAASWTGAERFSRFRAAQRRGLGLTPEPAGVAWADAARPMVAPGRRSASNAVLADFDDDGMTASAYLRPNLDYVSLFDHAYDHVPGVVQVEGGKQLAVWGGARRLGLTPDEVWVRQLDVDFLAINELDRHTRCCATFSPNPDGPGLVAVVRTLQDDTELGDVRALILPRPRRR